MRAGKLRFVADLLVLGDDCKRCHLDWLWCDLKTKDSGDVQYASGLRNPAKVEVRAWYDERLRQGCYLESDGRLLHIDSVRDVTGQRAELVMTATELIGQPAVIRRDEMPSCHCRAFVSHESLHRDEEGQATGYKTRAEVALIEAGRVQVDDQIQIGGVRYLVVDIDKESDDGIVRGLWLEALI